jgi:hypothetical protein
VLVIGGPWDGKRERMHQAPSRFYVKQLQKVSSVKDDIDKAVMTDTAVQYIQTNIAGYTVYYSHDDLDFDKHPLAEAVRMLIENYKAIA